jgi:4'-phosphopantetheinyl transferase
MSTSDIFISYLKSNDNKSMPCKEYNLNLNDIFIYTIYIPNFINIQSNLANFLNPTELERAHRFQKETDQNRFIIYRSVLKIVLAAYTKLEVKDIYFDYHSNKKPYLASDPWLSFNISHSEDFAIIAISRNQVGIDIEYIDEDFNYSEILHDIFNDNEILAIQNTSDKKQAFYTLWTRKEAFVKGLGKGIDDDFKYVPCLDGIHCLDSKLIKNIKNWQAYSFELTENYIGTIAFEHLSPIPKNIVFHTIPNNMTDIMEIAQIKNN